MDNDLLCSRRDLEARTHRRAIGRHYGATAPREKDIYSSSVMTVDHFIGPSACFLFCPILNRNPVDPDSTELSHKRQQGCISVAPIRLRDSEWLHFPSSKLASWAGEHVARDDCSRPVEGQSTAEGIGRRSRDVYVRSARIPLGETLHWVMKPLSPETMLAYTRSE